MEVKKRVLLIEDEVDLCWLMKIYFQRKNYEVFIAHYVYDALPRIKEYQPDTIYLAPSACQHFEKDIEKIKELAPGAEIIINGLPKPGTT